jgi:hypothetical protein
MQRVAAAEPEMVGIKPQPVKSGAGFLCCGVSAGRRVFSGG